MAKKRPSTKSQVSPNPFERQGRAIYNRQTGTMAAYGSVNAAKKAARAMGAAGSNGG